MPSATLVLTRPRQQAAEWIARLAALGVPACSLPLIEILPGDPQQADTAWQQLPVAALAVFVSPNAVEHFFAAQAGRPWPAQTLAACVGPGSARALREAGVPEALIVQPPAAAASLDSEHLWPQLASRDWQGRDVLLLRGNGGREWLAERLREHGATTHYFSVYRRTAPHYEAPQQALFDAVLAAPAGHVWLFSSAEGVRHLAALAPAGQDWSAARGICTHERIAEAARGIGIGHIGMARPDATDVTRAFALLQSFAP
ncbi:uroporphyrinogen-III synthase [Pelomonas sp. KK5]|uniref:uroporphyrinogen-III synthase n=1 Tax=Pelomonas sp. KK5 TaxID=1855730 RepID=UPI00097C1620|nr:uroporphyrinogen-III synthase [Pelomonas sp. KK5]